MHVGNARYLSPKDLPEVIPVFPLTGALLLPGAQLPLNIFEPRYLAMTREALAGPHMIGMVQPRPRAQRRDQEGEPGGEANGDFGSWPVFATCCAGRITAFGETDDGRYLITLTGLLRFELAEELPPQQGYRRVRPNWAPYRGDLEEGPEALEAGLVDRQHLLRALRTYFRRSAWSLAA